MIRQTMRSVALAAVGLLLANVAWGQAVLRQVTSSDGTDNMIMVAAEYFGGEPRSVLLSKFDIGPATTNGLQRPYVGLNLAGGPITTGNAAEITFTLAGATFDQAATSSNLDRRDANCAGTAGGNLSVSVVSGGARGDESVTYRAEARADIADTTAICFWVPDLSVGLTTVSASGVTPAVMGVQVTASIKTVVTTGTTFPATINGNNVDADGELTNDNNATGSPGPITAKTILQAANAVTTMLGTGDTAYVSVADRTKIVQGGTRDPSVAGTGGTMGLRVGTLEVGLAAANTIWKLEGGTLPDGSDANTAHPGKLQGTLDTTLSGQVMLSVGGRFGSGDRVVVGSGPTAFIGTPSGGAVEVTVQLEVGSTNTIVYVPGGVDNLKPGTFAAGGMRMFNDRRNHNAAIAPMSTGKIKYAGIEVEGYAYGVVRSGGMESSFVRVTCEASATGMCIVFGDCQDQAGMDYFSDVPVPISVGETAVWSSDDIAMVLGGGWDSGRGSCDIHSNGELSVQHMIRTGSTQINNSAVVGRDLDERNATTKSEIAAVKAVVDSICRSVGSATVDQDTTADGDQLTACYPQAPWRPAASN